jgi:hypothetical protein
MAMLGIGAGLVLPPATASVMGSLPAEHTGVGDATNSTFLQTGGALGVAVIGSLLSNRYQDRLTSALAPYHPPPRAPAETLPGRSSADTSRSNAHRTRARRRTADPADH